jgi:hypothetical protein
VTIALAGERVWSHHLHHPGGGPVLSRPVAAHHRHAARLHHGPQYLSLLVVWFSAKHLPNELHRGLIVSSKLGLVYPRRGWWLIVFVRATMGLLF